MDEPTTECETCFALVRLARMAGHAAWHDKIDDELLRLLHGQD